MRTVLLYTIGQGTPLFERYGHTLLCVREPGGAEESGQCVDYGVSNAKSGGDLVWGTLRGKPMFVATGVAEKLALDSFRGEGRAIERQELVLDEAQRNALADALLHDVESGFAYAYHPRLANCASYPRDRIDAAVGGRLKSEALAHPLPVDPRLASYRDQFEAGLSGHVFELTVGALIAGTPADPQPDAWATMYQPERLRDGVAQHLGAPIDTVAKRVDHPLPTSTVLGRGALLVFGLLLYWLLRRHSKRRWALGVTALLLGLPALFLHALAAVSVWPEFSHNWARLLLWPTDLALPWLPPRTLMHYARARVALAALLVVGELVMLVAQPIMPLAAFVALPMLALLLAERARTRAATEPELTLTTS